MTRGFDGTGAHVNLDIPHYSTQPSDAWKILHHFRLLKGEDTSRAAFLVDRFEADRRALLDDWLELSESSFCDLLSRTAVRVYSLDVAMEHPDVLLVLSTPISDASWDKTTIGEYLGCLLAKLWKMGEDFRPKYPLGESSWQTQVYAALIRAGFIRGKLGESGRTIVECEYMRADDLIERCVYEVFRKRDE